MTSQPMRNKHCFGSKSGNQIFRYGYRETNVIWLDSTGRQIIYFLIEEITAVEWVWNSKIYVTFDPFNDFDSMILRKRYQNNDAKCCPAGKASSSNFDVRGKRTSNIESDSISETAMHLLVYVQRWIKTVFLTIIDLTIGLLSIYHLTVKRLKKAK